MSRGGPVLILVGVWVLAQVFAGHALGRLGIAGDPTNPGTADVPPGVTGGSGLGGQGGSGGSAGGGGGGSW
jgi:hypothetical protein